VLENHQDMKFTKELLQNKLSIKSDEDYRSLIQLGFMTLNDTQSFWASIPNFGLIYGVCLKARKEILTIVEKQKFSEMNQAVRIKRTLQSIG